MDILNNAEIKETVIKWCEETKQRVIDNLKRRGVVAQLPLISGLNYEVLERNGNIQIVFSFERKNSLVRAEKVEMLTKLSVFDPLTGKYKNFLGKNRGTENLGFLRKANVYELIQGKYADELISNIIAEIPEIAGKILITGL